MSFFESVSCFRWLKRILAGLGSLIVLFAIIVASLVVFGTTKPPATTAPVPSPVAADSSSLPGIERYRARDGTQLSFRYYPEDSRQVVFLIHGASGSSSDMHVMAQALQTARFTVYVPDLRGHGENYPHGDVKYIGQLDDDLADLLHFVQPKQGERKFILVGFSSGGGFALRIAAKTLGQSFDRYVLLSPFLGHNSPTNRKTPASLGGNAKVGDLPGPTVSTGRIVGLMILNSIGIHCFDGMLVIGFAVPIKSAESTSTYSWRMQESFQPHDDFKADIRSVSRPMTVLVGADDERFHPEAFETVFDAERNDIPVLIVPGLNHSDMAISAEAIRAVVKVISTNGHQELH